MRRHGKMQAPDEQGWVLFFGSKYRGYTDGLQDCESDCWGCEGFGG